MWSAERANGRASVWTVREAVGWRPATASVVRGGVGIAPTLLLRHSVQLLLCEGAFGK